MSKLDTTLQCKIRKDDYQYFLEKCTGLNRNYTSVLREMVVAFNDGRLTIKPTEEQNRTLGEMYDN